MVVVKKAGLNKKYVHHKKFSLAIMTSKKMLSFSILKLIKFYILVALPEFLDLINNINQS